MIRTQKNLKKKKKKKKKKRCEHVRKVKCFGSKSTLDGTSLVELFQILGTYLSFKSDYCIIVCLPGILIKILHKIAY